MRMNEKLSELLLQPMFHQKRLEISYRCQIVVEDYSTREECQYRYDDASIK
jgi:hypothetical protein